MIFFAFFFVRATLRGRSLAPSGRELDFAKQKTEGEKRKNIKIFLKNLLRTPTSHTYQSPSSTFLLASFSCNFPLHRPAHAPFFTKLRFQKYARGKLFSSFSKTFFVPNSHFSPFSKLFPVQMQTASYLFTAKKREKQTTCTTETSKKLPSFG